MPTLLPFPVDPSTLGNQPFSQAGFTQLGPTPADEAYTTEQVVSPTTFGGALYYALKPDIDLSTGTALPVTIWKSVDSGATWTALDVANQPSVVGWQSCFDGNHTIFICSGFLPGTSAGTQNLVMYSFDLATELWTALHVAGPGFTGGPMAMVARSASMFVIVAESLVTAMTRLIAVEFTAGNFGTQFFIDTNSIGIGTQPLRSNRITACVDVNDGVHVFYTMDVDDPAPNNTIVFYQLINSGNVLATFAQLPLTTDTFTQIGIPTAGNNNVYFPYISLTGGANPRPGIFIGVGIAAPTFTDTPDIDPSFLQPAVQLSPNCVFDGTFVFYSYAAGNPFASPDSIGFIRICTITSHGVITGQTVLDIQTDPVPTPAMTTRPVFLFITVLMSDATGLSFMTFDAGRTVFQRYFGTLSITPPTPPVVPVILNAQSLPSVVLPDPSRKICN